MPTFARVRLPKIRARRCLAAAAVGEAGVYCTRAHGHTGRHASTIGPARVVTAVWS